MSSASSSSYVRVQLAPKAGFCVKTSTLTPAVLPPPPTSLAAAAKSPSATPNERLEPPPGPILVPQGRKVFVNIAWDPNVPPPPEGTEEDVRRAMEGADSEEAKGGWYVPVIVSHAREDVDKAGKPSLLFDCIFNSGVKARMLRDPDFKIFLVELALQRIEVQTGLALSRAIATPNIASKGKLLPRTITLPSSLIQQKKAKPPPTESGPSFANIAPKVQDSNPKPSPLIQEITTPLENPATAAAPKAATAKSSDTSLPGLRGILKKSNTAVKVGDDSDAQPGADMDPLAPLEWDWRKDDKGRLRIEVKVAGLTTPLIRASELDVSSRRIELRIPHRAPLDIDVAPSDAEIISRVSGVYADALEAIQIQAKKARSVKEKNNLSIKEELLEDRRQTSGERALRLKRQRDFDVEGAEAEWELGESRVVVYV